MRPDMFDRRRNNRRPRNGDRRQRPPDQNGNEYYKVQNSWTDKQKYGGYFYVSMPYFLAKTMDIYVNKGGCPCRHTQAHRHLEPHTVERQTTTVLCRSEDLTQDRCFAKRALSRRVVGIHPFLPAVAVVDLRPDTYVALIRLSDRATPMTASFSNTVAAYFTAPSGRIPTDVRSHHGHIGLEARRYGPYCVFSRSASAPPRVAM